jgi:dipeptidyl aminopeptidase/acylaminoacyl peptidase
MQRCVRLAVCLCLGFISPSVCLGQTPSRINLNSAIDELFATRTFQQAEVSPDGKRVAWVESIGQGTTAIRVADLNQVSAQPARITASASGTDCAEGHIAWSPDSRQLAFLSDAASVGQSELYVADVADPKPRALTRLAGDLDAPQWAPDGKSIGFLFIENAPRAAGPLGPMALETGVIESKVYEQRLAMVDLAGSQARQVSPADMYVYEYDWSPDSKNFALIAAHGEGDANWYVAQLYTLAVAGGEMKSIYKPTLQIGVPRWSPDGKNVAFIGGIMSDEGLTGGDIFVVPAAGGTARNVTPAIPSSPAALEWLANGRMLLTQIIDGETGVATLDLESGKITPLWQGPEVVSRGWSVFAGISVAGDGKTSAVIRQSFSHPPEVWAGPIGQWKQITQVNRSLRPDWGDAKNIHWKNGETRVQGWLQYPRDYDPAKRYPMVVSVHGGPGFANMPVWPESFFNTSILSTLGYFVLYPNPRGSFGAGEAFTRGNVKDFGYGDFRDILAGVDQVVKDLPVDNDRVGITGWSYGGYMAMWAVTQTQRFHAAVAGAGLSNWQSYYGLNDIDEWMIPFFGASVYDDPAVYAKSSPMTFIKNVKTPTLVLVGDRDGECPMPQSREFWHALKAMGVPTQLVIYANEGHAISDPGHQRDIIQRTIGWFDEHLNAR